MSLRSVPAVTRRIVIIAISSLTALVASSAGPAVAIGHPAAKTPGWRVVKTFATANLNLSEGVVAFKDGTAWVSGESETEAPVMYHLAGGKWSRVIFLGPPGSFVTAVSASSPANVWAALANEPDVAHLTSHGWVLQPFSHGTDQVVITAVLTFGPRNTWVFYSALSGSKGTGFASHFNGTSWHATTLPSPVSANGFVDVVSASSPVNIWALTFAARRFATLHYNGHGWKLLPLPKHVVPPSRSVEPRQILAQSPTNVWVTAFTSGKTTAGPIALLHWNGKKWGKESKDLPAGTLTGPIAPDGHGGLWLAADTTSFKPELLNFAGGKWMTRKAPGSPLKGQRLFIGALARIPGTKSSILGDAVLANGDGSVAGSVVIKFAS